MAERLSAAVYDKPKVTSFRFGNVLVLKLYW